jgi:ABC-type nitrate/sulfonate/bicarbonate transport system substrate-binding protein
MSVFALLRALASTRRLAGPADAARTTHLKLGLISEGTNTWPLFVAQSRGFFAQHGLQVEVSVVGSSVRQQQALIEGRFDIGFQQADHVVRAVEHGSDLVAFAAQAHAPDVTLVATPGITSIAHLRGLGIAVDGARTGYALLLRPLLAEHGIGAADVELKEIGGSQERYDALQNGAAAACMLNAPFDEKLIASGYTNLARLGDAFPTYPGSVMAARRSWADAHRAELAAFVDAFDRAYAWLRDPAHRADALDMLPARLAIAPRAASAALEKFAQREPPQITPDGMRQVVDIVWDSEGYAGPKGAPEKYMDVSYAGGRKAQHAQGQSDGKKT